MFVGAEAEWAATGSLTSQATVLDARRGAVVPGFVDAHTHVIFAGDRRNELRRRLSGASYAEIAAKMDMSPKAAKSLLYRARNQLRSNLSRFKDTCLV